MTPSARFVTKPGATCACKDCGAPLELACPNGHNPGEYILSVDEQDLAARSPAPPREKKIPVILSPTGLCEAEGCSVVFEHEKRPGRRSRFCPTHREIAA